MVKKITTDELFFTIETVRQELMTNKTWRLGQAIFNVFSSKFPIAEATRTTQNDCFYDNNKIISFMEFVLDEEAFNIFKTTNVYKNLSK